MKPQIVFEGKASIRFKSGAYTLVREHFEPYRNAAIGHKMGLHNKFLVDYHDRAAGKMYHLSADTTHQQPLNRTESTGSHYDEVGFMFFC